MKIKFTNPPETWACYLLGNEEEQEPFGVFIEPNQSPIYEFKEVVWDRFLRTFKEEMTKYNTRYETIEI